MAQQISIEEAWGKPFRPEENAIQFQPTHKQPEKMPVIPRADITQVRPADDDDEDNDGRSVTQNPAAIDADAAASVTTTPRTHVFSRDSIEDSPLSSSPINDSFVLSEEMRNLQQKISASFANDTHAKSNDQSGVMVTLGDVFAKLNEVLLAVMGEKNAEGTQKSKERRSPFIDVLIMVAIGLFLIYCLDMVLRLGQNMARATIKFA